MSCWWLVASCWNTSAEIDRSSSATNSITSSIGEMDDLTSVVSVSSGCSGKNASISSITGLSDVEKFLSVAVLGSLR